MSETSGQEKTEQATPKRLEDARKKGQVPRSKELSTAAVMLASAGALMTFGPTMITGSLNALKDGLTYTRTEIFDPKEPVAAFGEAIGIALQSLLPFFIVVVVAAICAPAMTGGWSFSTQAMAFKAEKLNPLKGIKRMFSVNALVELFKALAKFGVVGSVAVAFLYSSSDQLMSLSMQPINVALTQAATMGVKGLLIFSTPLLLIAAVDVPFQLFQHSKQMRMTRQEVRDEMKETDGNPEMKGRIRQMQMEQANARMMDQVSLADVIVTNPTHFAVALQYDPKKMAAPRVIAKGADLVAARIREIARENNVPLLEAPPLARALFRTTELNQEIPAQFFTAVAQVLTWVFQLKHAQREGGIEPTAPVVQFDE
ncbi:MAG: flagellar biosynthesis protein FlhB [Gammaproteobacteria bacterium]